MFKEIIKDKKNIKSVINYLLQQNILIENFKFDKIYYDNVLSKIVTIPSYSGDIILNFNGYNFKFNLNMGNIPDEICVYVDESFVYFPKDWDNYAELKINENEFIGHLMYLKNDFLYIDLYFANKNTFIDNNIFVNLFFNEDFFINDVSVESKNTTIEDGLFSIKLDNLNLTKIKTLLNKSYNKEFLDNIISESIVYSSFVWEK